MVWVYCIVSDHLKPIAAEERRIEEEEKKVREEQERIAKQLAEGSLFSAQHNCSHNDVVLGLMIENASTVKSQIV